ncbi:UDP-N-acetylmuramoyl-L-alanyl-D-glutamate--2,6-diaminopimelate ligase [Candidatus Gottesmanbacteria bacterium]|nr:UDP-N-acetylmuramoyl-L-alanyl-D-glutamate--2,6-diaminopimelate ligase [Candidatus Gottesmanbacteria bacterium]
MTIPWKKHLAIIRGFLPDDFVNNFYHLPKAVVSVLLSRYPARHLTVIGVTGTSGKTTTVNLIYHILKTANLPVSMISTVKAVIGVKEYDTGLHVTNPDSFELQKLIAEAVASGSKYLVLETTSHGLTQFRNFGANITIGVITNISHEHLDYHKTMRNYVLSKAKILRGVKYSVLNRDDKNFRVLKNLAQGRLVTFSLKQDADFTLKTFPFRTKLYGDYNKSNCLAAISVAKTLGIEDSIIRLGINSFPGVSGRMEEITKYHPNFRIFIDFAHKPNAFQGVLLAARKLTRGRVIMMFGSAGLRDSTKRPIMGEIAGKLADILILTAEDPRTENLNKIINQIARGAKKAGATEVDTRNYRIIDSSRSAMQNSNNKNRYFIKIPDRRKAINFTIQKLAQKGDVLLFCGKGHEQSMCFGTTEYPWNEKTEIIKALDKRYGK